MINIMKYKISALLTAAAMCVCVLSPVYAEEISAKDIDMVNQLKGYGILQGDENNNLNLENSITRTEMTVLTLRILGYEAAASVSNAQPTYTDIEEGYWGNGYISFATDMGIIDGFDDGTFHPEEYVLTEQALKMIVTALGYEKAIINKVYPDSYISMAAQLGLMDGTDCKIGEPATRGNVSRMIYNALDIAWFVNNGNTFAADENVTIRKQLEKHSDLIMYEGIVTATDKTNLYSFSPLPQSGTVMIDGNIYDVDENINADDYLGKSVQYFLRSNGSGDVVYEINEKDGDNSEFVVSDTSDIDSMDGSYLYYYESDKRKKVKLSEDYTVALNGRQYTPLFDIAKFKSLDAEIKFIDNDDDMEYEVVIVDGCESAVVDKVVPSSNIIVLGYNMKINGSGTILCEESDLLNGNIEIVNEMGEPLGLEDIEQDSSVSVYPSMNGEYMRIVITGGIVGVLDTMSESNNKITIDGVDYQLSNSGSNTNYSSLRVGNSYKFYQNAQGKIFYADERNTSNTYYYVMSKYKDDGEEYAGAKLISDAREIVKYDMADNVRIDGSRAENYLEAYNSISVGSIVNITLNSENEISRVENAETIQPSFASRIYTDEYDDDGERIRFDGTQIFTTSSNQPFAVDENTAIFFIPTSSVSGKTYSDEYYKEDYTLKRKSLYMTQAYDFDPETQIAKAVVIQVSPETDEKLNLTDKSPIGIVSGMSEAVDEEGNELAVIEMYVEGELITNNVSSDSNSYTLAKELNEGDVVRYRLAYDGNVAEMERLFTISEIDGYTYFHTGANSNKERYFGKVKSVQLNYLSKNTDVYVNKVVLLDDNETEADSFEFHTNVNNVFKISTGKRGEAEAASFYDIKCADDFGIDEASSVFMYGDMNKPLFIVIIN